MDDKRIKLCLDTIGYYGQFQPGQDGYQALKELREHFLDREAPVNANPERPQGGDQPGEYVCAHCGTARICDYCTGLNQRLSEGQPGEFGEPWVCLENQIRAFIPQIHMDNGGVIFSLEDGELERDRNLARRIVACVNACRGIPTEKLEAVPAYADLKIVGPDDQ